ncbi:hypothetical protein C8Q75DRAFT_757019 [Abortiporus biennis]|nr:hypothetical protein C8Q75DRAFT_757019 [Abortiporus biennis]
MQDDNVIRSECTEETSTESPPSTSNNQDSQSSASTTITSSTAIVPISSIRYPTPFCHGLTEHPIANFIRTQLEFATEGGRNPGLPEPLYIHLSHGLAYTTGSALGSSPPSVDACLAAFMVQNRAGLTSGARAWTKHAHRSEPQPQSMPESSEVAAESSLDETVKKKPTKKKKKPVPPVGWWGKPSGPVVGINERAVSLFWKIMNSATWRNLHWLPHTILVYEVRITEGYGMRWSQDQGDLVEDSFGGEVKVKKGMEGEMRTRPWVFRGFVEPMMENGHELGWRH